MSEHEPPPTYETATNHVTSSRSNIPPSYSFVALDQHTVQPQQQQQQQPQQSRPGSFTAINYDYDTAIEQTRTHRLKRLDYGMRGLLVILFMGGVICTALLLLKKFNGIRF